MSQTAPAETERTDAELIRRLSDVADPVNENWWDVYRNSFNGNVMARARHISFPYEAFEIAEEMGYTVEYNNHQTVAEDLEVPVHTVGFSK